MEQRAETKANIYIYIYFLNKLQKLILLGFVRHSELCHTLCTGVDVEMHRTA